MKLKLFRIAISTALATGITAGAVSAENLKATFGAKTKASAPAAYKAQTARGQAAGDIVRTWAGYVRSVYGTAPTAWARDMQSTFATADVRNLQRAAKMTTFEGMMSALMGQRTSDEKIIDQFARAEGALAEVLTGQPDRRSGVYRGRAVSSARHPTGRRRTRCGRDPQLLQFRAQLHQPGRRGRDRTIPAKRPRSHERDDGGPAAVGHPTVFLFRYAPSSRLQHQLHLGRDTSNELVVKQAMGQVFDFSAFRLPVHVIAHSLAISRATATAVEGNGGPPDCRQFAPKSAHDPTAASSRFQAPAAGRNMR